MKIVHVCLCGSYNDNWGYQDNIIPKYNKKDGHEVTVITSIFVNSLKNGGYEKVDSGEYILNDGVKIIRIPFKKLLINIISEKLRIYEGLYKKIENESPDLIFLHGIQFIDIKTVVKYVNNHPNCKIVADNHADFSNSAKKFLSKNILHKIIWRYCAQQIEPYVTKFYGVLPARVDFLKKLYNLPEEKVELLVMGADDEKVEEVKKFIIMKEIREKYSIRQDDFLIVTGGKIDNEKKQTLLLMKAVRRINKDNVKLIVFGSVINELTDEINELTDGDKVQYIGWINSDDSYKYFAASDLVVFPGRHSVFWEQVVGLGIPMIVKHWDGTTHVNLGGNCKFLYKDSVDEIYDLLINLINNKDELAQMREIAESKGMKYFSYKDISARAIEV